MANTEGVFIDWDGSARRTTDPGGGGSCEVPGPARDVAVVGRCGALVHEATLHNEPELHEGRF